MSIVTGIHHLQPLPKYAVEKPYTMRYVPEGPIAVSNVARIKHDVKVLDMRATNKEYSLDRNGFTWSRIDTKMAYEDYESHEKITAVHFSELENCLKKLFPGCMVDFVSYLVRSLRVHPRWRDVLKVFQDSQA